MTDTRDAPMIFSGCYDRKVEDELNASFKLVFEIPCAFEPLSPDTEVSVALRDFADTVEGIVKTFKAHCL